MAVRSEKELNEYASDVVLDLMEQSGCDLPLKVPADLLLCTYFQ